MPENDSARDDEKSEETAVKAKIGILILLSLFLGGFAWGLLPESGTAWSAQQEHETKIQIQTELGTFAKLAKELKPSVVNISVVKSLGKGEGHSFPFPVPQETSGHGSGVIVSADGEVLTNNHVIRNAKKIQVKLVDGREFEARVLGIDSNTDLALLKIEGASELPVADLGDSDALEVGDWVMAIGNPFGLEATVTVGVLSGKGRVIGAGPYDDFLQTDASINPGNSGGPLFSTSGQVIGINTAIVSGGQGIGFAIPINLAKDVSEQLKSQGRVVRGFIGAGIQSLTPSLRTALELPTDASGVIVSSLVPDGPAKIAGLEIGDIITAVAATPVRSDRELLNAVAKLTTGQRFPFTIQREGRESIVEIEISERPSQESLSAPSPSRDHSSTPPRLGMGIRDLSPDDSEGGVLVVEVQPGSPASRAGLRPGDIVRGVGSKAPLSAAHFVDLVEKAPGEIALLVERQGRTMYLVVKN